MTSPSNDDRRTPRYLFEALHAEHHFTVDACASAENALLPRFWTKEQDGLVQSWTDERVWANIPFSDIRPWVKRAHLSRATPLIVMLVPANRTEQAWWQDYVEPFRDRVGSPLTTEFIRGRTKFTYPPDYVPPPRKDGKPGSVTSPPFGVCLLKWQRA